MTSTTAMSDNMSESDASINIHPHFRADIHYVINRHFDVDRSAVDKWINGYLDKQFLQQENRYYVDEPIDANYQSTGVDTYPRDVIKDEISYYLVGSSWPTLGNPQYGEMWVDKVIEISEKTGWKWRLLEQSK